MYKWQQVKALRAKGVSIKKIARKLKLSKNTVRKYLRSSEPPHFKAREYEKMLKGYEDKIKEMLEKRYIGTRIYSELVGMGYNGSLATSSIAMFVKQEEKRRREKKLQRGLRHLLASRCSMTGRSGICRWMVRE